MGTIEYIKKWQKRNPEKVRGYKRKWRETHRDEIRIYQFLYGHCSGTKRGNKRRIYWGFLNGDGCCVICGEFFPFFLEQHHLFKESETQFTFCANCHLGLHRSGSLFYE